MDNIYAPLSEACAKTLSDKTYEKRKLAAHEIEKMVGEFNTMPKGSDQIKKLLNVLGKEFVTSRDPNKRNGGLIGLAAASIALGKDSEKYINELVKPSINCCLTDTDSRVRYFASESLYNVVKIARCAIIPLFPEIFAALSKLVTDPEHVVKNGSELLDRLLKDIVTESSSSFDLSMFIPLLRERVYTKNPFARQFVISWISVLNAVPEINLVVFLPEILDGLFLMLEDNMTEIYKMCETLLLQFLKIIRHEPEIADMPAMTNILIGHAESPNELIQYTSITWIREFLLLSGPTMLSYTSGIFSAVLPCLAYESDSKKHIKECAQAVNKNLLELISKKGNSSNHLKNLNLNSVMAVLCQYLEGSVKTKVAVLKWIHHLFTELEGDMSVHAVAIFPVLLGILSDSSDEVVLQGLVVLAEIVSKDSQGDNVNKAQYKKFLLNLLNLFNEDKPFLERRGSLIIRRLCVLLNAEYVFRTFAEIIAEEMNIKFASTIVRTLNMILLTSSEMFELRALLKDISSDRAASLFQCLYRSWSHCPVSTLSLCLLAQCYEHVSQLVVLFGNLEITVDLLIEIDKLVQLIESPIFASLRLSLVSPNSDEVENLAHALFGILMLLPQTDSFTLLKNRLQCIPLSGGYKKRSDNPKQLSIEQRSNIPFGELLEHFNKTQETHRQLWLAQRRK